jgi:hypothetical protein
MQIVGSDLGRDMSSVLSAIASATAKGLATEDSEETIARERASYAGHLTESCSRAIPQNIE